MGFFPAASHDWHNAGQVVEDAGAYANREWRSATGDRGGHVVYGPYISLRQSGRYRAWFRLRFQCVEIDDQAEVVRLEATCDGVIQPRLLRRRDNIGDYQLYDIPFSYQRGQRIELRIEKLRPCVISVDFTAVTRGR